ncbi:unnamed protein product [Phaeothamnion confervicola]
MTRCYLPTARQTNWLIAIAMGSVFYAIYLRYLAIEYATVSLACQGGLNTWLCTSFRTAIVLYNNGVFGAVAVGAAILHLLRPSILMLSIALPAAGLGLVLHNGAVAGLAVGLLVLSLARPVSEAE